MASEYPRLHKYDELGPTGKRLARVPRYGRLIAVLPRTRFERLSSEAATFWEVYTYIAEYAHHDTGLLDSGLRAHRARHLGFGPSGVPPSTVGVDDPDFREFQVRRACDILGAVAFEMYVGGQAPQATVTDTQELKKRVINRLYRAEVSDFYGDRVSKQDHLQHLNAIFAMDAVDLKYFIFSAFEREVRWTDITTQAFFAAYWACHWANDDDRQTMRAWLPDPLEDSNEVYLEFWRFATEMPVEAIDVDCYEMMLSPLYDGTWQDGHGLPIRSTELIYRTWDRMKETSYGQKFRGESGEILSGQRGDRADQETARRILKDSKGESQFLSLCEGDRGVEDTGRFVMGAPDGEDPDLDGRGDEQINPLHRVRLTHFRLHRYCVTNSAYELFDRRHATHREFEPEVSNVALHPVVSVGWYDAWCFVRWLGTIEIQGRRFRLELPTEAQWEYACRATLGTPFTWDGIGAGSRIDSTNCNFNGNYPWQWPGTHQGGQGPYRVRTVRVDGLDEDGTTLKPNRWGFFHLHGNTWEWCADGYDGDYYRRGNGLAVIDPLCEALARSRVVRGGSWINRGRFCRSGFRNRSSPDNRSRHFGFRVAAIPVERESGL